MRAKGALSQPLLLAAAALALTVSQAAAQCTNKPMNGNWPTDTKAPGWTCTGTVALGGTCSAACKDGWAGFPTAPTATCTGVNTWSVVSGVCRRVCEGMPTFAQQDITDGFTGWGASCNGRTKVNEYCYGMCAPGYAGNPRILCQNPTGQLPTGWTTVILGQCQPGNIVCPAKPVGSLINGVWPDNCIDSAVGQACQATCNPGYTSQPPPSRTCKPDGTWSSVTPADGTCKRVCTGMPINDLLDNGDWNPNCANSVVVGGTCPGICDQGYVGNPQIGCSSPNAATGFSGWTTAITGQCVPLTSTSGGVLCQKPTTLVLNGLWPETCFDSAVGQSCTATCNPKYTASPLAPRVQCKSDGSWTEILEGECKPLPTKCLLAPTAAIPNGSWPACAGSEIGYNCQANCEVGYSGPATVQCLTTGQWASTTTGGCTDTNACQVTPCAAGAVAANCADKAPPALGNAAGRTCTCPAGYAYNETTGCQNIDACSITPCHPTASGCADATPPADGTAAGRTCSCPAGKYYKNDAEGCVDIDACAGFPCSGTASCQDIIGGANSTTGRTCTCNTGFEYVEGTGCRDIDACQVSPCKSPATCSDVPAPSLARICNCTDGLTYLNDTVGCVEVNGCDPNPCLSITGSDNVCTDLTAPAVGFACGCTSGLAWNGQACTEVDGCSPNNCSIPGSDGTCQDNLAPLTGYRCVCTAGYVWNQATNQCINADACTANPCNSLNNAVSGSCVDLPPPADGTSGFNCSCTSGFEWAGSQCVDINACSPNPCTSVTGATGACTDTQGAGDPFTCACDTGRVWNATADTCDDVNACASNPCSGITNANSASCVDLAAPADPTTGFTCSCSDGFAWTPLTNTCFDVDGCASNPCNMTGATGACTDTVGAPNPNAFTCSCGTGRTWNAASKTCDDINSCASSPCTNINNAVVDSCTDLAAPADGFTCNCTDGFAWNATSNQCSDIDGCASNPCTMEGATGTCTDTVGAGPRYTCTCDTGRTWNALTKACENVNVCTANATICDGTENAVDGSCTDLPPPASSTTGFTCNCTEGYFWDSSSNTCTDVDGCAGNPCTNVEGSDTVCTNTVGAGAPYSCGCTDGREWNVTSMQCDNVNVCANSPAICDNIPNAVDGSCVDQSPPASSTTGFTCSCETGYEWNTTTNSCVDTDGCASSPCAGKAGATGVCNNIVGATTAPGYSCMCEAGRAWTGASEQCADIDACTGNPCGLVTNAVSGSCTDLPPPADGSAGYTCNCTDGFAWNATSNTCSDIDACNPVGGNPCTMTGSTGACTDTVGGGKPFTCGCDPGRVWNVDTAQCDDVDACAQSAAPCTDSGVGNVTCTDSAPPALGTTAGRTCACATGYEYIEGTGCQNIDACAAGNAPCFDSGVGSVQCTDGQPPLIGNALGRTCSCAASGFTYASDLEGCKNVDACVNHACHVSASCNDLPPPATDSTSGRTCNCTAGLFYLNDVDGCQDIDGCLSSPCDSINNAVTGSCADVPAPAEGQAGFNCSCNAGFEWKNNQCSDINGCASDPCTMEGATGCQDVAGAGELYTCTCGQGRTWDAPSKTCKNDDACALSPCSNNGVGNVNCTDSSPPALGDAQGRTCTCGTGWNYVEGTGCVDISACSLKPCDNTGVGSVSCAEKPAPALGDVDGRTCSCSAGYVYVEGTGCQDADACLTAPCTGTAPTVTCTDQDPPALNDATGRTCTCSAGLVYANDAVGCQDINSCAGNPCNSINNAVAGSCQDKAAPLNGFTCSCNSGFSWSNDQCVDDDACANNPCTGLAGSTGACADAAGSAQPPYTCTCITGRTWNSTTRTCDEIDGCAGINCGIGASCTDKISPETGYTCGCGPGTSLQNGVCAETNACASNPCSASVDPFGNGTCLDQQAPLTGYTCGCVGTHVWDANLQLCVATVCRFGPAKNPPANGAWPTATITIANGGCAGTPLGGTCNAICKDTYVNPGPLSVCQRSPTNPQSTVWTAPVPADCVKVSGRKLMSDWKY